MVVSGEPAGVAVEEPRLATPDVGAHAHESCARGHARLVCRVRAGPGWRRWRCRGRHRLATPRPGVRLVARVGQLAWPRRVGVPRSRRSLLVLGGTVLAVLIVVRIALVLGRSTSSNE